MTRSLAEYTHRKITQREAISACVGDGLTELHGVYRDGELICVTLLFGATLARYIEAAMVFAETIAVRNAKPACTAPGGHVYTMGETKCVHCGLEYPPVLDDNESEDHE